MNYEIQDKISIVIDANVGRVFRTVKGHFSKSASLSTDKPGQEVTITQIQANRYLGIRSEVDSCELDMDLTFESAAIHNRTKLTLNFGLRKIETVMKPFRKLIHTSLSDGARTTLFQIKHLAES